MRASMAQYDEATQAWFDGSGGETFFCSRFPRLSIEPASGQVVLHWKQYNCGESSPSGTSFTMLFE